MKKIHRIFALLFSMVMIPSLIIFLLWQRQKQSPWEGFKAPDDVRVAREVLSEQFTGPRYFHFVEDDETLPYPYISIPSADGQVSGVLSARSLPPETYKKIGKIIDKLAIRPSSRLTGVDRINFLQLNLALDEMR